MESASARLSLLRVLPALAVTALGLMLGLGQSGASSPGAALAVLLLLAAVTGLAKTSSA